MVTSITILLFNYWWVTDEKINTMNIIQNNLIPTNWIKPRIFMHFQLTLNCKQTTGSLELVVFKLLLVMHDANNYEVHVCTETSSVVTNPPSCRLIIYCIAVHTTTKIFYIYHNKIFGIKFIFKLCCTYQDGLNQTLCIHFWSVWWKTSIESHRERCFRVFLEWNTQNLCRFYSTYSTCWIIP